MLTREEKNTLKKDFRSWGKGPLAMAIKLARQYGVLCKASVYSDGKKG